jgi:hypothetical protein
VQSDEFSDSGMLQSAFVVLHFALRDIFHPSSMREVGHMLAQAIGRDEVLRMARAQAVLRRWDLIVGEGLAERSWPDKYERGTVWVAVEGSAWAQELRMIKERILDRLRERTGDPAMFLDVRFGVRPLRSDAPKPLPEDDRSGSRIDKSMLTISQIAELRMQKWADEERA